MAGTNALRFHPALDTVRQGDVSELDDDLVRRAKRDRDAFAVLYARYSDRIYQYCYLRLGDRAAAEDATSQTFANALAALHTCRDDRFRAWLFRIARNVVADQCREHRVASLDEARSVVDTFPTPEEAVLSQEGCDVTRRLLARLPEAQRRIVELRLAGLTGAEIARVLGRPHVWVRVTQLRAYERLRRMLEESDDFA